MIKEIEKLEAEYGITATKEGFKEAIYALHTKKLIEVLERLKKESFKEYMDDEVVLVSHIQSEIDKARKGLK